MPLLTVSIYDLHHIIGRFVRLYRRVQVVSDCLVFTCSILCCQCWAMLPENAHVADKDSSHEGFTFLPQHRIDEGKAGGDLLKSDVITDFSPQKEDSEEVQKKCIEFLKRATVSSVQETSIESNLLNTSLDNASHIEQIMRIPTNQISSKTAQGDDIPAVHTKSKMANNSAILKPSKTSSSQAPHERS